LRPMPGAAGGPCHQRPARRPRGKFADPMEEKIPPSAAAPGWPRGADRRRRAGGAAGAGSLMSAFSACGAQTGLRIRQRRIGRAHGDGAGHLSHLFPPVIRETG
jgi:hypothetical protein